jgi:hydrogenase nickel incorporation protein HypA/HybF
MHEFSICQSLLRQVDGLAALHRAQSVSAVKVAVGPLSGVEPGLLERAFTLARSGGVAAAARLIVETTPIVVRCRSCGVQSEAAPNRLVCGRCGDFRVELASGDELILLSVDLDCAEDETMAGEGGAGAYGTPSPPPGPEAGRPPADV